MDFLRQKTVHLLTGQIQEQNSDTMCLVSKSVCAKVLLLGDLRCITHHIQQTVKCQSYTGAMGESGGEGWVRYLFRCGKAMNTVSVLNLLSGAEDH